MKRYLLTFAILLSSLLQSYDYSSEEYAIKNGETVSREVVQDLRYKHYACTKCPYVSHKKECIPNGG